jgi:hypothetical protein
MGKRISLVLLVCVVLASVGLAAINRQIWDTGTVTESDAGVRDFFADKRPDMMPFTPAPDIDDVLDESTWPDRADAYYGHLWGWVTIPESGDYTWYIHGDNNSVLYVSSDENWENVQEVAWVTGWSNIGEWTNPANGGANTASDPMTYAAGQTLAVWAIMVEGSGGDNLGIGWTTPSNSTIDYISDYVTNIPPAPTKARSPMPDAGAVDVPRDTSLSWAPGKYAALHDVYLGTVFEDVNDASRSDPRGVLVSQGQSDTTFVPPDVLGFGQTYYWRIDEVNAPPDNTVFKGKVWEFTVEPLTYPIEGVIATSNGTSDPGFGPERTVDGSGLNADDQHSVDAPDMWLTLPGAESLQVQYEFDRVYKLDEMLIWNYNVLFEMMLGFGLKDVTIEYSENGADWTVLGDFELAQAIAKPTYEANTTIDFSGLPVKLVRLTVNSGWGPLGQFGLSEVRFMYVPAHAREPQPADMATGVPVGTTLSWRAGREAVTHDVYLGTDAEALELAGSVDAPTYTPTNLEFGLDYSWKVDEVNEADAITTWEGSVWSFQTEEYALIDGFEDYNDDDNRIFDTWFDGFVNGTGSTVGYFDAPFAEQAIVNSGGQSMPLEYVNDAAPFYSEAQLEVGTLNLNGNGADSLRLYVAGLAPAFLENADGTILMNAIGADIWDAADECRYAYKELTGNGSMVARVDDLDGVPSTWAKAGVMVRQSTAVGSVHSVMCLTGGDGNGASWQGRPTENGTSENNDATTAVAPPYWVRIDRSGDTLTGYLSPDGQDWTQLGDARSIPMTDPVLIGLALTSHNANQATSAAFSNVSFTGSVSGDWQVAEIGVAQPAGNAPAPVYVALEDSSGGVAVVTHPDDGVSAWSTWTEWTIPYSDLAGVNLSRIAIVYVGVGDRDNPTAGGTGTIYVDDIGYGRALVAP